MARVLWAAVWLFASLVTVPASPVLGAVFFMGALWALVYRS